MEIDVPGRIRNTKLARTRALLPMFEAIVNSIHSVNDAIAAGRLGQTRGRVEIRLTRRASQRVLRSDNDEPSLIAEPVETVTVIDNGIGFTDENFRSFLTSDTRHKVSLGGRGIGRFLWLVAFDHAEIQSAFRTDEQLYRRMFSFKNSETAVEEHDIQAVSSAELTTTVRLVGLRPDYQEHWPRQAPLIGKRIVEHCLNYLVVGDCPRLVLVDEADSEQIDLNELYAKDIQAESSSRSFVLRPLTRISLASCAVS